MADEVLFEDFDDDELERWCEHVETTDAKRRRIEEALRLNDKQQYIFNYFTQKDSFAPVFVSGSAGTGKSALLMALQKFWRRQNKIVLVAAYTNLAARNVDGKTCHSLFGFDFNLNMKHKPLIDKPKCVIIDEISMIPAKMLDGIDRKLKQTTGDCEKPFGGVNVIAFGDLYQLPPVNKTRDTKPVYTANAWTSFRLYELTENMRQSEGTFIENLNLLRVGDCKCLKYFNSLKLKTPPRIEDQLKSTSLVSTHNEADAINRQCYEAVAATASGRVDFSTESVVVERQREKDEEKDVQIFTSEQEKLIFKAQLELCVGARVMITHATAGFCNGDLGTVEKIDEARRAVSVRREYDNQIETVTPIALHFYDGADGRVKRSTGLPLAYGWAVTIHKAQGMTLKNLIVYPACVFAPGQAYVALSRTVHSSGLKLVDSLPKRAFRNMINVDYVYKNLPKLDG
ncbi:helicase-2 [Olene mendosa nucleopolyhedrovirus]|uniref:Helicase-2 n=1 Tax=Olene mendosa nucleopolyhedrovirus TaxID=2933796 RepID=A0AAX3ATU6_9ABAC|nr:helicase-2 [Olene mendosa nucleopolyhedrovirus]UOQ18824.1 helicase-2 [Olene mendosa nucleopolyhedrovirus]